LLEILNEVPKFYEVKFWHRVLPAQVLPLAKIVAGKDLVTKFLPRQSFFEI